MSIANSNSNGNSFPGGGGIGFTTHPVVVAQSLRELWAPTDRALSAYQNQTKTVLRKRVASSPVKEGKMENGVGVAAANQPTQICVQQTLHTGLLLAVNLAIPSPWDLEHKSLRPALPAV